MFFFQCRFPNKKWWWMVHPNRLNVFTFPKEILTLLWHDSTTKTLISLRTKYNYIDALHERWKFTREPLIHIFDSQSIAEFAQQWLIIMINSFLSIHIFLFLIYYKDCFFKSCFYGKVNFHNKHWRRFSEPLFER